MPGASVTLTEESTHVVRTAKTDSAGAYVFPNITVGTYTLTVSSPGFQTHSQVHNVLEVGSSIGIDAHLAVGKEQQTVTVEAEGLALQTEDAKFKQTVDERQIAELPLNSASRQVTGLIALAGGTTPAPGGDFTGSKYSYQTISVSIDGGQGNSTIWRLDGGDNTNYTANINMPFPFPDALNQFSVESSVLGAQDGINSGGKVNAVTRSGTNSYHGNAFEFLRNNYINARNFFSAVPDSLHQNQFGGTFGGPIIRNKLFAFAGYQRLQASQSSSPTSVRLPTAANLAGDFSVTDPVKGTSNNCSSTGVNLLDPLTGNPIPGNKYATPPTYNASALAILKVLPTPADQNCGTYTYTVPTRTTDNQFVTRVDWNINPAHNFYGRYFIDGYQQPAVYDPHNALVTTQSGNLERVQSLTFGENWAISSRTVNSAHITLWRIRNNRGYNSAAPNATAFGINVYQYSPAGFYDTISNRFTLGCGTCIAAVINDNAFNATDEITLVRGHHSIVVGAEFVRNQLNFRSGYNSNGNFSTTGELLRLRPQWRQHHRRASTSTSSSASRTYSTKAPSSRRPTAATSPAPMCRTPGTPRSASQLLPACAGHPTSSRTTTSIAAPSSVCPPSRQARSAPSSPRHPQARSSTAIPEFLATSPATARHSSLPTSASPSTPRAMEKPSSAAASSSLTTTPTSTPVTATSRIRPSRPTSANPGHQHRAYQPYQSLVYWTRAGIPIPGSLPAHGYQRQVLRTVAVGRASCGFPSRANLAIHGQHAAQLRARLADAVGLHRLEDQAHAARPCRSTRSTSFLAFGELAAPAVLASCKPAPPLRSPVPPERPAPPPRTPFPARTLTQINPVQGNFYAGGGSGSSSSQIINEGWANYNGIVASLQHRLSSTFSLLTNYTWSKCLNVQDAQGDITTSIASQPFNLRADYGPCGSDYRHIFNTAVVAESRFHMENRARPHVVNGWQIAPIVHITSGAPFTVTSGVDNSFTSVGIDRPNIVPGAQSTPTTQSARKTPPLIGSTSIPPRSAASPPDAPRFQAPRQSTCCNAPATARSATPAATPSAAPTTSRPTLRSAASSPFTRP